MISGQEMWGVKIDDKEFASRLFDDLDDAEAVARGFRNLAGADQAKVVRVRVTVEEVEG